MQLKKYNLLFFTLLISIIVNAQDIAGTWSGILKVQSQELPIVFHISKKENKFITTMDSPAQGAFKLPTDSTFFENNKLKIVMSKLTVIYEGELQNDIIKGTFTQGGMPFSLNLKKGTYLVKKKKQEPTKPYPYLSEEVIFNNPKANNIKFSGTLTIPKGMKNPPVAILISGSGPQNRDEELLGHKPFLVLSDYLTRNGTAVLRYDDRGTAKSEGNFKNATTFDFVTDAEAAVQYLKTRNDVVNINKIGLIGHSEGGLIAPIIASKNKSIAFIVLLAGPGVSGKEILLTQSKKALELVGLNENDIELNNKYSSKIYDECINYNRETSKNKIHTISKELKEKVSVSFGNQFTDEAIESQIKKLTSPWMLTFIKTNPQDYLVKVTCPVLALNGEKDFQVISQLNLNAIKTSLEKAKNKDVTIKELKDLNHLFQTSKTGSFSEYASNEETFSPIALKIIADWIKKRF